MASRPTYRAIENVAESSVARHLEEGAAPGESRHGIPGVERPAHRSHIWTWLVLAAAAIAAWYYRPLWLPWVTRESAAAGAAGKKGTRVVPVRTAVAERRN